MARRLGTVRPVTFEPDSRCYRSPSKLGGAGGRPGCRSSRGSCAEPHHIDGPDRPWKPETARRAGLSVAVLQRYCAKVLDGEEERMNALIEQGSAEHEA